MKQKIIRHLIADDVGTGKTVQVGLIIKELKRNKRIKKILIVTPSHLTKQWQSELKHKFYEKFQILEKENIIKDEFFYYDQLIISIDIAKRNEVFKKLCVLDFDLAIIDEAHKMSSSLYFSTKKENDRYGFGRLISKKSKHLILLSATPHSGDGKKFLSLMNLLIPDFFDKINEFKKSVIENKNPFFTRRMKESLTDFDNKPLFPPRAIHTIKIELIKSSPRERDIYDTLTKYIIYIDKYILRDRKGLVYALILLQRRFASSLYALQKSLTRRIEKLKKTNIKIEKEVNQIDFSYEDYEGMEEVERWQKEQELLDSIFPKISIKEEIKLLKELLEKIEKFSNEEKDYKFIVLIDKIKRLNKKYPNEKIIIFTESKDTLDYLEENLKLNYKTISIHGKMQHKERLEKEREFIDSDFQILIGTEIVGEGINLQKAGRLVINYDIPWNPGKLEQRMGRVHRIGQTKSVFVYNLIISDTCEGRILTLIIDKQKKIRKEIGTYSVFDVIGEVVDEKRIIENLVPHDNMPLYSSGVVWKTFKQNLDSIDTSFYKEVSSQPYTFENVKLDDILKNQDYIEKKLKDFYFQGIYFCHKKRNMDTLNIWNNRYQNPKYTIKDVEKCFPLPNIASNENGVYKIKGNIRFRIEYPTRIEFTPVRNIEFTFKRSLKNKYKKQYQRSLYFNLEHLEIRSLKSSIDYYKDITYESTVLNHKEGLSRGYLFFIEISFSFLDIQSSISREIVNENPLLNLNNNYLDFYDFKFKNKEIIKRNFRIYFYNFKNNKVSEISYNEFQNNFEESKKNENLNMNDFEKSYFETMDYVLSSQEQVRIEVQKELDSFLNIIEPILEKGLKIKRQSKHPLNKKYSEDRAKSKRYLEYHELEKLDNTDYDLFIKKLKMENQVYLNHPYLLSIAKVI